MDKHYIPACEINKRTVPLRFEINLGKMDCPHLLTTNFVKRLFSAVKYFNTGDVHKKMFKILLNVEINNNIEQS